MRKLTLIIAFGALFAATALPALAGGSPVMVQGSAGASAGVGSSLRQHLHWFAGSVTAVGSSSLTVGVLWTGPKDGALNGQTVTVNVPTNTRINGPHGRPIALAQIQTGDLVASRAAGTDPTDLTAAKIRVFCNCHWVGGTIASVTPGATPGTGSFTVSVKSTGPYDTVLDNTTVTMQVGADTVYLRGPRRARIGFSDLKVGEGVGTVFSATGFFKAPGFNPATATFSAARVHVWGARQVPPASSDAGSSAGVSVTS